MLRRPGTPMGMQAASVRSAITATTKRRRERAAELRAVLRRGLVTLLVMAAPLCRQKAWVQWPSFSQFRLWRDRTVMLVSFCRTAHENGSWRAEMVALRA